jgi:predicted lipid-binding transport protein (Tim44 family)
MTRRRLTTIALIAVALLLIAAPTALAAAGGGSAGFGGGGGGGGGGRGVGLYILIQILIRIAILGHGLGALVLIGLIILGVLVLRVSPAARGFATAHTAQGARHRRRTAERERRVHAAAAEAAEEDPALAPDVVKPAAVHLFEDIQKAWDRQDRLTLHRLVAPTLAREWDRRLDDFARRGWRNRVQLLGEPRVEYVGLNATAGQVVVRIEGKLRDYAVDRFGNHMYRAGRRNQIVKVREFWTLAKRDGRWILASIEQGAEGAHALSDKLIATPWSDDSALRDEAMIEQAATETAPNIADIAKLDYAGDAHAAALDLSLADGRFAPDLLEVAARRAVNAWATAVDGDQAALNRVATPAAVDQLLHPDGPNTRLVVRGPTLDGLRITSVDATAQPPTMTIEARITGRRYLQDRDTTAILAGSPSRPGTFTEHWTFALTGHDAQPWRITSVG